VDKRKLRLLLLAGRLRIYLLVLGLLLLWLALGAFLYGKEGSGFSLFILAMLIAELVEIGKRYFVKNEGSFVVSSEAVRDAEHARSLGALPYWEVLHELSRREGLETCPILLVAHTSEKDAGIVNHPYLYHSVVFTDGALERLDRKGIEALGAHEFAHGKDVKNGIFRYSWQIAELVLLSLLSFALLMGFYALLIWLTPLFQIPLGEDLGVVSVLSLISAVMACHLVPWIRSCILREKEFRADLGASQRLGETESLMRALTQTYATLPPRGILRAIASYESRYHSHPSLGTRIRYLKWVQKKA
jgi:Zn-dependent protease with chaperone function